MDEQPAAGREWLSVPRTWMAQDEGDGLAA
jgi:hypothetical protein